MKDTVPSNPRHHLTHKLEMKPTANPSAPGISRSIWPVNREKLLKIYSLNEGNLGAICGGEQRRFL